ncbi:MAG: glycosyltransferase [Gammaproteobacteria bacterium]|nr:glycosyltransferase [Gammaproteobacteria bacterium]
MPDHRRNVGIVAIGRNEGERLERCLRSAVAVAVTDRVVYVDSGSTDDSVAFARSLGVEVVNLDTSIPFTAARARNEGIARLKERWQGIEFVQVLDGDCELQPGWIDAAMTFMQSHDRVAVVCGRTREQYPEASVYNRLCDLEWDTPVGPARSCGGNALLRLEVFDAVGGYNPGIIAGEEPELCVRVRGRGYEVHRLDQEMTLHDAAMTRFDEYWQRAKRAGHACAQGADMHGKPPERHGVRQTWSALIWGLLLPVAALLTAYWTHGVSLVLYMALVVIQIWRIRRNELQRGRSKRNAILLGVFFMIAKYAQASGVLLYWYRRLTGRHATLIEYKHGEEKPPMGGTNA